MSDLQRLAAEQSQAVIDKVMEEQNIDKTQELISMFNLHQSKRSMLRVQHLSGLWDTVTGLIEQRFRERPDQFSNDQLLNYLKVVQEAIDKASKGTEKVDEIPSITLNYNQQNNLNVQVDDTPQLDRAS